MNAKNHGHFPARSVDRANVGVSSRQMPRALALTAVIACCASGRAFGQQDPTKPASLQTLQTVIVTARKQSQPLQTVPMSITAIGGRELAEREAFDVGRVIQSVPNVSFSYGTGDGRGTSRQIALRGIYGAGNIGGSGTTGFYLDDIPLEESAPIKLVDVNHIEVLRGPQGTLYGARSMGGTVKIVTNQPSLTEASYDLKASVDHVDRGALDYSYQGTANVPVSADVAIRTTAYYDKESGIFDRVYGGTYAFPAGAPAFTEVQGQPQTGVVKDTDGARTYGVQLTTLWIPIGRLSVTPKVVYQMGSADGASLADATPNNFVQRRAFNIAEPSRDRILLGSLNLKYDAEWGTIFSSSSQYQRNESEIEDSSEEVASPDAFGFIETENGVNVLVPYPAPISRVANYYVTTEELRFLPNPFGRFNFIGGIFYQRNRERFVYSQNVPGISAYAQQVYGLPFPPFPTDNLFYSSTDLITDEWAAYGELTYHFTQHFSATLGARPDVIHTSFGRLAGGLIGGSGPVQHDSQNQRGVIPKAEVNYAFDANRMVYASAAKGLRAGGFNAVLPSFCAVDLAAIGQSEAGSESYRSDSLWSYEVGTKLESSGHRARLNGAVYYIDWTDILQNIHLPCGFNFLANAGKATSLGGELEAAVRVASSLTWTFGMGYTDAKLTEVAPGVPARVGNRIQEVPRFNGHTSVEYDHPVTDDLDGTFRMDVTYVGKSFTTFDESDPLFIRHKYTQFDFRIGMSSPRWEAGVFVRNAFNVHANLGTENALALDLAGRPRITVNRPRTVGMNFAWYFQ